MKPAAIVSIAVLLAGGIMGAVAAVPSWRAHARASEASTATAAAAAPPATAAAPAGAVAS
jgi:hypothetical protein